jgi:hypothetical protein
VFKSYLDVLAESNRHETVDESIKKKEGFSYIFTE